MGHDDQNPAEWVPLSRPDTGTDQIQRSLEYVEKLLERLEYGPTEPAEAGRRPRSGRADDQPDWPIDHRADQLLAAARREADAKARDVIEVARIAADEIRAAAKRDADEIVCAARARSEREIEAAESRAARRVETAEHEALEMERNAWSLEHVELNRRRQFAVDPLPEPAAPPRRTDEQELIALAVTRMQHASRALTDHGEMISARASELLATALAIESLLHARPPGEQEPSGSLERSDRS